MSDIVITVCLQYQLKGKGIKDINHVFVLFFEMVGSHI